MIGLTAALIAAAVALVVAVGTQVELARRERRAQAYERRRQALLDAQDAVVALRGRVREYGVVARSGAGMPSPELDEASRRFDDARVLLMVTLSRVDDEVVRAATDSWAADAQQRYVSTQDVSAREEDVDWTELHDVNVDSRPPERITAFRSEPGGIRYLRTRATVRGRSGP